MPKRINLEIHEWKAPQFVEISRALKETWEINVPNANVSVSQLMVRLTRRSENLKIDTYFAKLHYVCSDHTLSNNYFKCFFWDKK